MRIQHVFLKAKIKSYLSLYALIAGVAISLQSCGGNTSDESTIQTIDSLRSRNVELELQYGNLQGYLTTISEGLDSIAIEEQSVFVKPNGERVINRTEMKQRLDHVRMLLENHRGRLAELESRLDSTNALDRRLRVILSSLRQQLEQKDAELAKLKADLNDSRRSISELRSTVSNLETVSAEKDRMIEQQQEAIETAQNNYDRDVNTAYVCIATKKQLQDLGLLTKGNVFKKSKMDYSSLDPKHFTEINKRTTTSFELPKKYKIITPNPGTSYSVTKNGDTNTLHILDTDLFWSVSKFLIIQIN